MRITPGLRRRPGTARAPIRCAAPAWPRAVCGSGEVARPQRITGASRGTRQPSGDSASRRVWGRHRGSVPGQGNQDRTRGESLTTPGPTRRKKTPKAALRGHRSLDNRGPHKGSARVLAQHTALAGHSVFHAPSGSYGSLHAHACPTDHEALEPALDSL